MGGVLVCVRTRLRGTVSNSVFVNVKATRASSIYTHNLRASCRLPEAGASDCELERNVREGSFIGRELCVALILTLDLE